MISLPAPVVMVSSPAPPLSVSTPAARTTFFETTFTLMGRIAKSDGRVSEQEVAVTEQLMGRMGLSAEHRREAEAAFERIVQGEGLEVLGWRNVPTNNGNLGATAKAGHFHADGTFHDKKDK